MNSILATGCSIPIAIENPSSYYTGMSLTNRARDLSELLDLMSQKAQTLNAALTGIDAATFYLEQMISVAEQTIMNARNAGILPSGSSEAGGAGETVGSAETNGYTIDDFIVEGYKVVSAKTTTDEFQALLDAGEKIVLGGDIAIDSGLEITQSVVINGNGHTITFVAASGDAIVQASGEDVIVDISNLHMEVSGFGSAAIQVLNGATIRIDDLDNITVSDGALRILNGVSATYNGKANTAAFVEQLGDRALAAYAALQFYAPGVDKTDADFGQGQWYIPSLGELMEVYGTNYDAINGGDGTTGSINENKTKINRALSTLASKDVDAGKISDTHYWSSSELPNAHLWRINMQTGGRGEYNKDGSKAIRFFQRIEGAYDPTDTESIAPVVGDIMYADKSYGCADNYDSSKVVVGVITQINADGAITIMNLRNVTFTSVRNVGNFDADNPYSKSEDGTFFTSQIVAGQNITAIDDYDLQTELDAIKSLGKIEITGIAEEDESMDALAPSLSPQTLNDSEEVQAMSDDPPSGNRLIANIMNFDNLSEQYSTLIKQYDDLVNNSGYQGINLLKGDTITIFFNEARDHSLTVTGEDISSSAIGITDTIWETISDITSSIKELRAAITKLRTIASDIGSNSLIIKIRQSFTENLINILEEGADKLMLADMNEVSAEYLVLQTRESLAIQALSLANEASRSIFMLF